MKDYVNLFYSILENIDEWDKFNKLKKTIMLRNLLNIKEDDDFFTKYFDKYRDFLIKNPLKNFTKDIIDLKF